MTIEGAGMANITIEESPSKRMKTTDINCLFRAEIPPSGLKLLADNISHVIKTVELHIVVEEGFQGIRVETLDDLKVCLVIAQLPCSVYASDNWNSRATQSVSISIEWLLLTLRQIDVQYTLVLEQFVGQEDTVRLRSFESLTGEDELIADLCALVPTNNGTIKLKEFPVQFRIEMDLQTVRTFLKSCESIKAEDIEIIVKEHKCGDSNTIETVTMKACEKAAVGMQRTFKGIKDNEETKNGLNVLDEGTVIFNEAFSTKYLNNFVRSMNRTNITLHMSPKNPLHVSYPLGTRDSSITFILAPREPES